MSERSGAQEFEGLLREFDETVAALESDGLSLEEALAKYESAVSLADQCARILKSAELRIIEIDETLASMESSSNE